MKIIKRNGAEVPFDITKIITAVTKASDSVGGKARLSREQITDIAAAVTDQCQALNRAVSVEEVQDMVENQLMDIKAHDIARHYITYRYIQSLKRQTNTTDERILSLIECQNEEVKQENANKNPTVNSVQRDYMAGEISKDLTARLLLDPEIVKAHQEGLIHFHDSDYFAQHMHNCDLINLDDMLQNGTVISGTYIEKPHSFSTACNIATQIIAQVASNQYGGQSISLTHLAPFVDVSRKKIAAEVEAEMEGLDVSAERKREIVERRLRNEINRGVQTIQYQVVTLMTTNGQAPFITVFMYLGEARNAQEKADLAIIIEETIRQRYQGVKNEAGVWITPAFPKLIYVLEEDNIRPGTPYYYLTELAAKCTAKRIEIRIGSSDSDASGQFTASLLKGKILYTAILHFLQFITGNAHIQMPVGRKAAFQCLQHCTVFCRLKTSRRVCPHISATGKLLPADGRIQHFQLAAGRQLTGKLPNGHLFRKTCQYGNFQAAIFSPCLVFQGIRTRTRIITRLTPIGFFQRCNRTVRQMQAKTDITAIVLDIRGKYRTVAGFQAPCRMSAIQSTCVAVLSVDADKLFTGRQVLQHTGSSPLMVIVGSGFYQIACFLRSFRRRSILRVRTQRDKQSKNNCKNRNTVHKVLFNSKDEGITESHSLYD